VKKVGKKARRNFQRKAPQNKMASYPKKTAFDQVPVGQFASIKNIEKLGNK
jgi:hypothetical protein